MMKWFRRRNTEAALNERRRIVDNISRLVEYIEEHREAEGRKLGQRDVEAIKMVGTRIAQNRWPQS